MYVKANGEVVAVRGLTDPAPFDVIVIKVALVNTFPLTDTGAVPHVLPFMLLRVRDGPFIHPQETENVLPVVAHPEAFLTVIEWLPFAIPVNVTPG